jgi:hypothetical protein
VGAVVWQKISFPVGVAACFFSALIILAAVPGQVDRPPQPFFQDFYSGTVTLQDRPAPSGTQLIACVADCVTGFQSQPVQLGIGGVYKHLEVNPSDEALIGRTVGFYLANTYGKIKAAETRIFVGIFDFYTVDLTFNQPLPVPTPTPTVTPTPTIIPTASLPVPGDPSLLAIPGLVIVVGAVAVAAGTVLILMARRWPH